MIPIKRLLWELKFEITKIVLISAFLDAAIAYLIISIVLNLFDVPWWVSLAAACLIFAAFIVVRSRRLTLAVIERKNPIVNEMLRTSRDNIDSRSIMAQALFMDVLRRANNILVGNLISYRMLIGKVTLIAVLSVVMVTVAAVNIKISEFRNPFEGLFDTDNAGIAQVVPVELADAIYGDASVAPLGDETLELMLSSGLSELDPTKAAAERELELDPNGYPVEIKAVGSEASSEEKPRDTALAATYNQKLQTIG